eukprot:gnl/TRDRNA2_/TRDRNA2_174720_c1_seq1.p1 gnl/TRDRNA2_/TRDRNA2_174720_c1~~gnl/TRDRNA2_/TRDRNA2_174720_c1_seq1.p1  ORF type:complete len:270 (+),score=41.88 gnl/TRDRNA2_/TRDRNA2_174720_c1_seq1:120-929(+)
MKLLRLDLCRALLVIVVYMLQDSCVVCAVEDSCYLPEEACVFSSGEAIIEENKVLMQRQYQTQPHIHLEEPSAAHTAVSLMEEAALTELEGADVDHNMQSANNDSKQHRVGVDDMPLASFVLGKQSDTSESEPHRTVVDDVRLAAGFDLSEVHVDDVPAHASLEDVRAPADTALLDLGLSTSAIALSNTSVDFPMQPQHNTAKTGALALVIFTAATVLTRCVLLLVDTKMWKAQLQSPAPLKAVSGPSVDVFCVTGSKYGVAPEQDPAT